MTAIYEKTPNLELSLYGDKDPADLRDGHNSNMRKIDDNAAIVSETLERKANKSDIDDFTTATNATINDFKTATNATINDFKTATNATINDFTTATNLSLAKKVNRIDVKLFGAIGDGEADDTQAIQNAINAADERKVNILLFPEGTYKVNTGVEVPDNFIIKGTGNSVILCEEDTNNPLFVVGNNFEISNINANINKYSCLIQARKLSKNVKIHDITLTSGKLLKTQPPEFIDPDKNTITESDMCENFSVYNNTAKLWGGGSADPAINLNYVKKAIVKNNILENSEQASSGIQWWGGDSAKMDYSDFRGTQDIIITDNIVKNVAGGGIWGSAGENILVANNIVEETLDVGIDLEGCVNVTVNSNSVKNARKGNYVAQYGFSDIIFSENKSYLNEKENPHEDQYLQHLWTTSSPNLSGYSTKTTISVSNNSFTTEYDDAFGSIVTYDQHDLCNIRGNVFTNSVLNLGNGNVTKTVNVSDNVFTADQNVDEYILKTMSSNDSTQQTIENNLFYRTTDIKKLIYVNIINNYNGRHILTLRNNTIQGLLQISSSVLAVVDLLDNIFSAPENVSTTGENLYIWYQNNLIKQVSETIQKTTYSFPNSLPDSGNWLVGQKIYFKKPTNYLGVVATQNGASPAWKYFAPLTDIQP